MIDLAFRNKNYQQKYRDKKKAEEDKKKTEAQRIKTLVEERSLALLTPKDIDQRGRSTLETLKRDISKRIKLVDGKIIIIGGGKKAELINDVEILVILLRKYESEVIKPRIRPSL